MHVDKLRITDPTGLVPAGQYFKLLADALRQANAREQRVKPSSRQRASTARLLEAVQ